MKYNAAEKQKAMVKVETLNVVIEKIEADLIRKGDGDTTLLMDIIAARNAELDKIEAYNDAWMAENGGFWGQ